MLRARVLTLALLASLVASGLLFGQARDFDPPTPEQMRDNIAGTRPQRNVGPYHPRRHYNSQQGRPVGDEEAPADGRNRGRSPFAVMDNDGRRVELAPPDGGPAYPLTLDLDQYMLDFDFEVPQWIEITAPDGTPQVYWYMIFRVTNWETHPVYAHLSFAVKTMAQDIYPDPHGLTPEQEQEIEQKLMREFVGKPETVEEKLLWNPGEGEEHDSATLESIKREILRGIKRSLALDYLNYPDRALMDAICNKERRWEEDANNRLYNSLVPAHYFQWRMRLMPEDNYEFPTIVVQDHQTVDVNKNGVTYKLLRGDTYIVQPQYDRSRSVASSDAQRWPKLRVTKVNWQRGGNPDTPREFNTWDEFKNSDWGRTTVNLLAESGFSADTIDPSRGVIDPTRNSSRFALNSVPLWEAVWRYWPRYQKGDRVDQYGFVLRPGHPDYERGVLMNSDFSIRQYLHGAQYVDIDFRAGNSRDDNPYFGMAEIEGTVTLPESPNQLPTCNGRKLVAPPVETMSDIIFTMDTLRDEVRQINQRLASEVESDIQYLRSALNSPNRNRQEVRRRLQKVIGRVTQEFEQGGQLPDFVAFDIERIVVRQSRLYFAEAHNQRAKIIGYQGDGDNTMWEAQYRPAFCFIKTAAPRRYENNQRVLQNYKLPVQPNWTVPGNPDFGTDLNRPIGEKEAVDPRIFVNGLILDVYEYDREIDRQTLQRPDVNRFGETGRTNSYQSSRTEGEERATTVSRQQPFFDLVWNRDGNMGRPVKRVDHQGRSLADGFRLYRPGDRVTPMEWRAYGSLVPIQQLKEYAAIGAYEEGRPFLRDGDLLVGQPRLVLAEFRFDEAQFDRTKELLPIGTFIGGQMPGEHQVMVVSNGSEQQKGYWRFGFRCDAAGDYDAIVFEELPSNPGSNQRTEFDAMVQNTLSLEQAIQAALLGERSIDASRFKGLRYLRLVPVMDTHGVAMDYVNPLTHEKMPQRINVLPEGDERPGVLRDEGGNPIWAKEFAKQPNYLYDYDYVKVTGSQADANKVHQFNSDFDIDRLEEDAKSGRRIDAESYWGNSSESPDRTISAGMTGLFRPDDRPTLGAARVNVHFQRGDFLLIERANIQQIYLHDDEAMRDRNDPGFNEYDRVIVNSMSGVYKILNPQEAANGQPRQTENNPDWRGRGVAFYGRIIPDQSNTEELIFEITSDIGEIVPAIAEGVAIFGGLDQQWDFMNVYVSGIKGPIRRDGLNAVRYTTMPSQVGGRQVERYEFAPRFVRENWVMMLRFDRPGDEYNVTRDKVTFSRKYWLMDGEGEELTVRER